MMKNVTHKNISPSWRDFLGLCKIRVVALMLLTVVVAMLLVQPSPPWHALLFGNRAELLAMRAKLLWQNMDKFKKLDVERSRFNVLRTTTDIKKVAYYCIKDVRKNGLQNFDLANTTLADKLAVA